MHVVDTLWLRWCECVDGCSEGGNMKEILLTMGWLVVLDGLITLLWLLTRHNGMDQIDFKIKIAVKNQENLIKH
jgi:hypothetical protein